MICTGSHNQSIHVDDYKKFADKWDQFMKNDITVWKDFHEFWLKSKIPCHIIRYEDIVATPEQTLKSLLEYILNVKDISGTKVEKYLKLAVAEKSP